MKKLTFILSVVFLSAISGCKKDFPDNPGAYNPDINLPSEPYKYSAVLPSLFGGKEVAVNDHVATLGRVLFYDKLLSLNNTIACASCHKQQNAFADPVRFSVGFEDKLTGRNSMHIVNAFNKNSFFWDERASSLFDQVLMPVQNHIEMGFESLSDLESKLSSTSYYPELFQKAFGSSQITEQQIAHALEEFIGSMASYRSKYDEGAERGFTNFTQKELLGKTLFLDQLNCGGCHMAPDFTQGWGGGANIGLDENYRDDGMGYGHFQVPSLRNVALTAPYMHDGRFQTLEEVVEHYNSGVKAHPQLDWRMINFSQSQNGTPNPFEFQPNVAIDENGNIIIVDVFSPNTPLNVDVTPQRLHLSQSDKDALVAFLNTLSDYEFVTDPKFSDPFK